MIPYPASLPVEDVQLIVAEVRGGTVVSDRARFAKAVWELLGFALKSGLGDPAAPVLALTHAQAAGHLESLLGGSTDLIPWRSIVKWALATLAEAL